MTEGTSHIEQSNYLDGLSKMGYKGPLPQRIKEILVMPDFDGFKEEIFLKINIVIILLLLNILANVIILFK